MCGMFPHACIRADETNGLVGLCSPFLDTHGTPELLQFKALGAEISGVRPGVYR